jgi:conjugative transfer signal peptidase TraF
MPESLLPLARWGNALRAARVSRRRLRRHAAALALLGAGLAVTIAAPPRPILVWNASASAPVGLYAVAATAPLKTGDMVIARIPGRYRQMAARRHYLPANVPLVKRVAAEPGDTICARGVQIRVNGKLVAERRAVDGAGRAMPAWTGCVTLRRGALFLLIADSPGSFDGRYFGPSDPGDIVGKATLLWRR